jgi:hypothetical protein
MSPRPPNTSKAAASGLLCRADNETRRVGRGSRQEVTTAVRCSRMPLSNCYEGASYRRVSAMRMTGCLPN